MDDLVTYLDRGLQFKRPPTDDEMKQVGITLEYFTDNLPWIYADWVNKGFELFGEEFSQHLPDVGRSIKTRKNWIFVGTRIPFEERKFNLDFSFYSEVARLLREAREALLTKAELDGWSVSRLRKEIRGERPKKPAKTVQCPRCQTMFEVE
jgi:hypothetical protein